jgi:hypothetical protein
VNSSKNMSLNCVKTMTLIQYGPFICLFDFTPFPNSISVI